MDNLKPQLSEKKILDALRDVYDPEIPVNVVDLGLIYQVKIIDDWVGVKMTLTSPGCGLADQIAQQVREKVMDVPGVINGDVRIVWQPEWNQNMIHPDARKKLATFDSAPQHLYTIQTNPADADKNTDDPS